MKKIWISLAFFILLCNSVLAADRIIINSENWQDVYSGMLFGTLTGQQTYFLVSEKHSALVLGTIPKDLEIRALSSTTDPYVVGYQSILTSRGFHSTEDRMASFNLELAKELEVNNFIIIDDSYGYNAVSVAPYAAISNSYVLFASKNNIDEIDGFLQTRDIENILIYGHVNREVQTALAKYNPEIINHEGDRFANNIEIVKKYIEINPAKQVLLTNGEFIESEIMLGVEPVVFIGSNNVPDVVREYIQSSNIDIGILVGNELVGTATYVRRQLGISVFVKFAQGSRVPNGAVSQVEALDMFYLPVYNLNIVVDSVRYNQATQTLEVTIRNSEEQAVYLKGTYSIEDSGGESQTVGDEQGAVFLDGNELRTFTYEVSPLPPGEILVSGFIIFGESTGSLEKMLQFETSATTVEIYDNCEIEIEKDSIYFDKRKKSFYIEVTNIGETDCYVDLELTNVIIDGAESRVGGDIAKLDKGESKKIKVGAKLTEEDIAENDEIDGIAFYGQREDGLVKQKAFTFEISFGGTDYVFYILLAVIIILLLLILWKRRKDEEKKGKK